MEMHPDPVLLVKIFLLLTQVWDYVMPFWLEAIRTEVPADERHEMKVLLR